MLIIDSKNFTDQYYHLKKKIEKLVEFRDTNWVVMTGPPGSGKSTSLRLLKERGYRVNPDVSREYIVSLNRSGRKVTKEELYSSEMQRKLFYLMTEDALSIDRESFVLHDYALPCNIAFLKLGGLPVTEEVRRSSKLFRYKKVFIFEPLELVEDGVRTENENDQKRLYELLGESYVELGYDPVIVKSDTIKERDKFLVEKLSSIDHLKDI